MLILREDIQLSEQFKSPHPATLRREAVQLHGMREALCSEDVPEAAPARSLGGEALQLSGLWQKFLPEKLSEHTSSNAHRGEALQLCGLWEMLCIQVRFKSPPVFQLRDRTMLSDLNFNELLLAQNVPARL